MNFKNNMTKPGVAKRILAAALAATLIFTSFSGFAYNDGFGKVYKKTVWDLYENTTLTDYFGEHTSNGIERAYVVEADVTGTDLMPVAVSGEVHSMATLGTLISYYEDYGYHVVAAINADIFDTSSGTPKGTVIHAGNIVTSGYAPDRIFAFDKQGRGSIRRVDLSYSAHGTISFQWPTEQQATQTVEKQVITTEAAIDENGNPTVVEKTETVTEQVPADGNTTETVYETIEREVDLPVGFFNVPHGAAKALHLYNRHYGTSTHTSGSNVEVVIEAPDIQMGVNKTIKGIVKQVGKDVANTPITDNTVVLSTATGSATADKLSCLKIGSEIEIACTETGGSNLDEITEAVGFYYSIVENGRNSTSGTNLNPRTALGVKEDGTLVMAEVDGRQSSVSKGLNLPDLSRFMISLGCSEAVNLDGGGSSVIYARKAGVASAAAKLSSPSGGSERRISNAILLVYKNTSGTSAEHLHISKSNQLVMPGADVTLSTAASDAQYEKVSLPGAVSYSVAGGEGEINGSVYTAGSKTGEIEITAKSGNLKASTNIDVVDDIIIKPSVTKLSLKAGETKDLSVTARYGSFSVSANVNTKDSLFDWSCDPQIGTIDKEGVFTAVSGAAKKGNIYIKYGNKSATIAVNVGADITVFSDTADHWAKENIGVLASLGYLSGMGENKFQPDGQLTRAQFVAMLSKINSGINSESEMAAGDTGVTYDGDPGAEPGNGGNAAAAPGTKFTDVPDNEWFKDYVYWAYNKGIVSGMGDGTFAPNAPITREQMAVMLCKYSVSLGFELPSVKATPSFTDASAISEWSLDYVITAARAGIITGFDTGEFSPQGLATRAQAAAIIFRFAESYGLI